MQASARQRFARFSDRIFDRLRDKRAFTITDDGAIGSGFDSLRDHPYAVLVTFRRNGDTVPSPVWVGVDERGRGYVKTVREAGKVKRLRGDGRALIAPSNMRGKPAGPAIKGVGRVLPSSEWAHAEQTLAAAYGIGRRIFERVLGDPEDNCAYIEITPAR
jgi:PPOX class probable F420-dependent enzyme